MIPGKSGAWHHSKYLVFKSAEINLTLENNEDVMPRFVIIDAYF